MAGVCLGQDEARNCFVAMENPFLEMPAPAGGVIEGVGLGEADGITDGIGLGTVVLLGCGVGLAAPVFPIGGLMAFELPSPPPQAAMAKEMAEMVKIIRMVISFQSQIRSP